MKRTKIRAIRLFAEIPQITLIGTIHKSQSPARLVLDNVRPGDAGGYRCRVDFYRAPTTIANLLLDVIGQ